MRTVIDTNILISALIVTSSPPARILDAWLDDNFTLLSSEWQLAEIRRVSRYEHLRRRLKPHIVGRLVKNIRSKALQVEQPPKLDLSPDPDDNALLAIAIAGQADYLVSGDKRHVLSLERVEGIRIITARAFLGILG